MTTTSCSRHQLPLARGERVTFSCLPKIKSPKRMHPGVALSAQSRQPLLRCSTSGIHAVAWCCECANRLRGLLDVRPCTFANWRASCAPPCGLFLRLFAAPQGGLFWRRPAAEETTSSDALSRDGRIRGTAGGLRGAEHRRLRRLMPVRGARRMRARERMYTDVHRANPAAAEKHRGFRCARCAAKHRVGRLAFWLLLRNGKNNPRSAAARKPCSEVTRSPQASGSLASSREKKQQLDSCLRRSDEQKRKYAP